MSFSVPPAAEGLQPTNETLTGSFRVGACRIDPDLNRVTGPAGEALLEPKTIAVLVYLAARPGRVISTQELIRAIWLGRPMGDNPVYRCISQLRRALGDDPRRPRFIATVATKGYRLVAAVELLPVDAVAVAPSKPLVQPATRAAGRRMLQPMPWRWIALAGTVLALLLVLLWPWPADRPSAPTHSAPTHSARLALAVLPFEIAHASVNDEYLADGIAEGVLNRLAAYDQLRVIARTSSFSFKGSDFELPRVARLLGVEYLLHGHLTREGTSVRIATELVDGEGRPIWRGSFVQAAGSEDYAVRDEIATAVVTELAPQLLPLPREPTRASFEAYQHYLIGHELMVRRPEGFAQAAREQFDRAIVIDPMFAEAYAERAVASLFAAQPLLRDDFNSWFEGAWRDILKAQALNPDSAQAHAASGLLVQFREPRDNVAAEASLRRALALDPHLVNAWNWLANVLEAQGRNDESDEALEVAVRIDPLAPTIGANLARRLSASGQFEVAEARLLRLMEVPQPARLVTISLIDLYLNLGKLPDALEIARDLVLRSISGAQFRDSLMFLAWTHAMLGEWEHSTYWMDRAGAESGDPVYLELSRAEFGARFGHPAYADSAARLRRALDAEGLVPEELSDSLQAQYGVLLALAGDHRLAIQVLERFSQPAWQSNTLPGDEQVDTMHALAWSWQQTDQSERAASLLGELQGTFRSLQEAGRLELGRYLFMHARNELLLGEPDRAIALLERAERAGWIDYHSIAQDPRWAPVRGDPEFEAVMTRMSASIDMLREQIRASAPENAFIARLDVAQRAADRSGNKRN